MYLSPAVLSGCCCIEAELKVRLRKCDSDAEQLEAKLRDETNKVDLLQADLAQLKVVLQRVLRISLF